eukprot:maker-scaffold191_size271209-snap-gene-1.29 protein:Tk06181 transcript:maker-scaffold191_size271209-snap-gene-1.29-mRNA-1 annotation:"hypothetical protein DAPPUDRAFT_192258"
MAKLQPGQNTVDIFPQITFCALDIICESAMGRNINAQGNSNSPYVQSLFKASDIIFHRQTAPWMWNDILFHLHPFGWQFRSALKVLHDFTDKVITDRKALFKAEKQKAQSSAPKDLEDDLMGKKKRLAFLDLLIEVSDEGKILTDRDIREEVDTFMFEGHDTTAANMSFTLYLLAIHPEIQKKVQQELDDLFIDDPDRPASMDDLAKMKYLEACIKESLRLYPSVPLMSRTIHEDTTIEGQLVPAETNIILYTYLLHRDPEQFPNPEEFDPERFSSTKSHQRHAYAYVPFSAGPRNCIGQKFAMMEEKVVVSSLLRKFNLSSNVIPSKMELLPELILRPKDGIQMTVTKRTRMVRVVAEALSAISSPRRPQTAVSLAERQPGPRQLRAGLSSLNELTVHAVAMETWRAFYSQDGPDGSRNALGQVLFPSNVATRSTRSETAGVVSLHLPYAANTLVDNGIALWNKFPPSPARSQYQEDGFERGQFNSKSGTYLINIREKVVALLEAGDKPTDIAKRFGIARSTVYMAKKLYDETGGFKKRENGGSAKSVHTEGLQEAAR